MKVMLEGTFLAVLHLYQDTQSALKNEMDNFY